VPASSTLMSTKRSMLPGPCRSAGRSGLRISTWRTPLSHSSRTNGPLVTMLPGWVHVLPPTGSPNCSMTSPGTARSTHMPLIEKKYPMGPERVILSVVSSGAETPIVSKVSGVTLSGSMP